MEHDREQDSQSSIVIIEAGAGFPAWITEYQQRAPNAAVVAQTAGESPVAFRARVLHRLDEITRSAGVLSIGIALCVEDAGGEQRAARASICREIVGRMRASGDLVLAATDGDQAFKHELFALAGELCSNDRVPHVNVRVRFANNQSGTMPSVVPVAFAQSKQKAASTG
jgi:hypothetical protein